MGESHENLLKAVRHCQESLDKYTENRNDGKILHYLEKLYKLPIKVVHLEQTGVGRTVNGLRKLGGDVGDSAKGLVAKWKEMVVGEQEEDDDDDEDEEDDEDEDGYQTGEEHSSDSDRDKEIKDTSSSHRKSDNRTDDRDTVKSSKHSSSKSEGSHSSDSSKHSRKEKDRHRKHNGHNKHKSHKRKYDSSSSEDESPKKRQKEENRHKSRSESEEETKSKERKHKSDKYKEKKHRESSPEVEERSSKSSKDKQREKEKHKGSSRKEESRKHEKKTKEKDKKTKEKEKVKEEKKPKPPKTKVINGNIANTGIDSGSGASFAEALGMCGQPSSSKNVVKKKSSSSSSTASSSFVEKKEKISLKPVEDPVPKLLKEPNLPNLEPIDINISSLLPPITPNYRPLGNVMASDLHSKKWLSESEALTNIITSKKERTKVYSGNKTIYGKVPSLFDLCIRILQDNIDALEYTGGVPYSVLKPILEKANPNQLYSMEHHNPYLIEDTDELWQLHCQKDFRNKKREELETWREMYLRCLDERDAKLKALTANIKQAQDKSLPVRMTKLAYVDAVAKPPRNIARKQAKNGTAFDMRKPAAVTPSARLNALATSGEAGKVAVPNPGSRAVERVGGHAAPKPKKAPLMLKSISSFKNRFKR